MLSSPKTYDIMRETDLLILPSQRTLKDYSNWFKPKIGFQNEVFIQLSEDYKVSTLNEAQRNIVLVIDEMKVQEGLVFSGDEGVIIGYVDTGEMNSKFRSYELDAKSGKELDIEVATHMLVVYARGVFLKLEYPLAQFPTTSTIIILIILFVY
jgi:hypothetical protein